MSRAPPLLTIFLNKRIKLCQGKPLSEYSFHANQQYHIIASVHLYYQTVTETDNMGLVFRHGFIIMCNTEEKPLFEK